MLNKLLALLLSAGLLLSPLNTSNSPSAASDGLTANVAVTVGKQQAVWGKYTCTSAEELLYYLESGQYISSDNGSPYSSGPTKYQLDAKTGLITFSDYISVPDIKGGETLWFKSQQGVYAFCITRPHQGGWLGTKQYYDLRSTNVTVYSKGTYVGSITANKDSLPQDGRHTDGYWYVFKKLVED